MRPLLLALIALCLAGPARAELRVYSHTGVWDVFSGTGSSGQQACGIGTTPSNGRAFSLHYMRGASSVIFVAAKSSWNIPAGTTLPVVMQAGANPPWTVQATGHGDRLEWSIGSAEVQAFDTQFRRAETLTISFPSGSEPPWKISLRGSTAASDAMGRCVTTMTRNAAAALPAQSSRQAAAAPPPPPPGPTQPFVSSPAVPPPATPATPAQPGATQPIQLAPPARTP